MRAIIIAAFVASFSTAALAQAESSRMDAYPAGNADSAANGLAADQNVKAENSGVLSEKREGHKAKLSPEEARNQAEVNSGSSIDAHNGAKSAW